MNTKEHSDGWDDFADLLALIRNLFGDALKASEALAPKVAESASRWLRAAEAFARVLVLTLARTVALSPVRTAGALAGQAVQAEPPNASEAQALRIQRGGGRSLFALPRSARVRFAYAHLEMTIEQERAWYLLGGKEAAAERRAQRLAEGVCSGAPAPCQPVVTIKMPAASANGGPQLPTQANLVRRYNALVRVFEAPDKAAQRLARRLAAAPALTQHILAAATPRERWRSGYDDTIQSLARAAAVSHDTS